MKKAIPNAITSMNLLCGVIGVVFAFRGRLDLAFAAMLAAAACDFLDGFAARLLEAESAMGRELDSLADEVSFGVLPAIMLYCLCDCYIALILAVFSALRLARFNVDAAPSGAFKGLPTPASALLCGSLCCFAVCDPGSTPAMLITSESFVPTLTAALCLLLVCRLPMFSLKFHRDDSRRVRTTRLVFAVLVAAAAVAVLVLRLHVSLAVAAAMVIYILQNLVSAIIPKGVTE